ncbi:MAG: L,D-transpeptidase family protein [Gammaproteobacteria bacterium]|nr:L,D-transpeptidase family protein [Gammaproteobacteria bacterium]
MNPIYRSLLHGLVAALAASASPAAALPEGKLILEDRIRQRLEAAIESDSLEVLGERLHAGALLQRAYSARGFRPFWVTARGVRPTGENFVRWLSEEPDKHGLSASDYHLRAARELHAAVDTPSLVDLELALSDAFLMLGSHLLAGRLNPESQDPEWRANRRHRDLLPVIERAAMTQQPGDALLELLPRSADYEKLIRKLAELRNQQSNGGWPPVPQGPTLREGDDDIRVAKLGERLRASGEFSGVPSTLFGTELADAVRRFQSRHGLGTDGVVGQATLKALNVSVEARIDQIIVNLERWRWLPEDLGERYILVNIAGFTLDVIEKESALLSMRVVVGQPYRRTPVFSSVISYLVFNPSWEVPFSIAVKDKLPLIKGDPGYLARQGYTLLEGWGASEKIIDPLTVDWATITAKNFPFRLRQSPGPHNALGRVKFMFPNEFAVYLHDTPSRELFVRERRPFSSGCIRLQHPIELAELLLAGNSSWNRAAIDRAISTGRETTVRLPHGVPVHLLYWTAWVDADDALQFRDDIYFRDTNVLRLLHAMPPD